MLWARNVLQRLVHCSQNRVNSWFQKLSQSDMLNLLHGTVKNLWIWAVPGLSGYENTLMQVWHSYVCMPYVPTCVCSVCVCARPVCAQPVCVSVCAQCTNMCTVCKCLKRLCLCVCVCPSVTCVCLQWLPCPVMCVSVCLCVVKCGKVSSVRLSSLCVCRVSVCAVCVALSPVCVCVCLSCVSVCRLCVSVVCASVCLCVCVCAVCCKVCCHCRSSPECVCRASCCMSDVCASSVPRHHRGVHVLSVCVYCRESESGREHERLREMECVACMWRTFHTCILPKSNARVSTHCI